MTAFFTFIFVLVSFALILVILLQSSKGGGLAGAFGGGGGDTMGAVFGGRGAANFLSKTTTWLAVGFLGIAVLLSVMNKGGEASQSLVGQEQKKSESSTPASSLPLVPMGDSQDLLPVESGQTTGSDTTK